MKYCARCVIPETRPGQSFDADGVCNACRNFESRTQIDWAKREKALRNLVNENAARSSGNYDCVIPVSGGKDSIYQVIRVLEMEMKPLCVKAKSPFVSALGDRNLQSLINLGVDFVEVVANPLVKRRLTQYAFRKIGKINWTEHVLSITAPMNMAIKHGIPLGVLGENPENEYGGPEEHSRKHTMDKEWFETYGGLNNLMVDECLKIEGIEEKDLILYRYPSDDDLRSVGLEVIYLGYYLPWDSYGNSLLAQAYGFQTYGRPVEGSFVDYENLDNVFYGIHDYLKYLKFGYGRASDQAAFNIRRGRLSREDAVKTVPLMEGKFPVSYLGFPLDRILEYLEMGLEEFVNICDQFTNPEIFEFDDNGAPRKDKNGNVIRRRETILS